MENLEGKFTEWLNAVNEPLGLMLVVLLAIAGVWFTLRTRGVQFVMLGEMFRLLMQSDKKADKNHISSFQAFNVALASRIGTGNLAGVATAIALGGPGAIFWMWVMALIGAANAFIESTLAQLFKTRGADSFIGGPAYYIEKGLKKRWFAIIFAVAILLDFGLTNNMVQSNTISIAFTSAFGVDPWIMGALLAGLSLVIIFGGIQRIANVSSVIVPLMAVVYLIITVYIIAVRFDAIPGVIRMIFENAFGVNQAVGGTVGAAVVYGFKRGLFSNEAGEGSAPNAAATAAVTHPVKQGLVQALGVFTDTLLVCSCTAFIILSSGLFASGANGIELTQLSIESELSAGKAIIAVLIFFFAFSSIIGNYYYGECNLYFITRSRRVLLGYRLLVGVLVMWGAVSTLELTWGLVDFFMVIMTVCNLIAILLLGKYAVICLNDYRAQRRKGLDPVYRSSTIPSIASETPAWDENVSADNVAD